MGLFVHGGDEQTVIPGGPPVQLTDRQQMPPFEYGCVVGQWVITGVHFTTPAEFIWHFSSALHPPLPVEHLSDTNNKGV